MTFKMFSPDALKKFAVFCDAANLKAPRPEGAFDQALKPRKESKMTYRYVPVANVGTAGALYMRSRSNVMAFDEVSRITEFADDIVRFLSDKLSDDDMKRVVEMLKMEAGVPVDSQVEAEKMIAGAKARGATDSALDDYNKRFPSAARIGRDPLYSFR